MHFSRITLSFGRHADRGDIPGLARTFKAGGYGVFIDDCPLPDRKRMEHSKRINASLEGTRARIQSGQVIPSLGGSYNDAIIETLLQTKNARYFLVEGYTEEQLGEIDRLRERRDGLSDQIFRLALSTYQVEAALRCTREYLYASKMYIRARNMGILDGFQRLHGDLQSACPGIASPVSVYARFGLAHLALGELIKADCPEIITVADPSENFITEIVPRLTGKAPYFASEAEVVRTMFAVLFSGFGTRMPESVAFDAIGRERGFLNLLDGIAGTRGASEKFHHAITAGSA